MYSVVIIDYHYGRIMKVIWLMGLWTDSILGEKLLKGSLDDVTQ